MSEYDESAGPLGEQPGGPGGVTEGSAYSSQTDSETETTMTDEQRFPEQEGDDAFGGAVGDRLPGGSGSAPRPSREQTAAAYGVRASERGPAPADATSGAPGSTTGAPSAPEPETTQGRDATESAGYAGFDAEHPDTVLAAERLTDLQRLQAEYVNYKRRVDRDREVQRDLAVGGVIESLLPVLDEIHLARLHGELEAGPFAKIAEKLEGILGKYGVTRFGQPGETFDPMVHQALMHTHAELAPGTTETTVVQVMQPGYKLGDRIVRPAMVAVADPA